VVGFTQQWFKAVAQCRVPCTVLYSIFVKSGCNGDWILIYADTRPSLFRATDAALDGIAGVVLATRVFHLLVS
jgi:hypothetical protein